MNIGVIGLGYWGPNIVRDLTRLNQTVFVYDRDPERTRSAADRFPSCIPVHSIDELFDDPSIAALALAVPLPYHAGLVLQGLRSNKHLFVEKPLCATIPEADEIREHLNGTVLMVAHITQFSRGVERLSECVRSGLIGDVCAMSFTRSHMGPVYPDTDVLTEIAAHDVAILTSLTTAPPAHVHAWGVQRLGRGAPDAAHIVLDWRAGQVARIDVQWGGAMRRREVEIEGTRGTLVLRSHKSPEELTHYDHAAAYDRLRGGERGNAAGNLVTASALDLPPSDPLRDELAHFLDCIEHGRTPVTDYAFSRNVVAILSAAGRSLRSGGSSVDVG